MNLRKPEPIHFSNDDQSTEYATLEEHDVFRALFVPLCNEKKYYTDAGPYNQWPDYAPQKSPQDGYEKPIDYCLLSLALTERPFWLYTWQTPGQFMIHTALMTMFG